MSALLDSAPDYVLTTGWEINGELVNHTMCQLDLHSQFISNGVSSQHR